MAASLSRSMLRTATGKSSLRSAIVLALILVVALYLFAQFIRRTSMFVPARFPEGTWETHALAVQPEDISITASDGVRLHGWLFRANGPLLVYCHGNAGNLSDRAHIAAELAHRGVTTLLFDWRGYGKSDGYPTESALFRDALAAYDYASTLHITPIAMYGESLGGPYAAYVAAHRKVSCVVIENTFPSLAAMGNAMYRPLPLGWFAPLSLRSMQWLNDAGVPVLVMHGKRDTVIPFALGMDLYNGLRVPKELLISETGGHCEMASTESARYYDTVVRFVTGR